MSTLVSAALSARALSPARRVAWAVLDHRDARRGTILPPRRWRHFVGAGDYVAVGDEFVRYFVELGGLARDASVLDVNSGIGRVARPLSAYLSRAGSYVGVDSWETGVAWCRERLQERHEHFSFTWVDHFDHKYNPDGSQDPKTWCLDLEDASFDFASLIAILTLQRPRLERYVEEIARLLRPGGTYVGTWYLLSDDDERTTSELPLAAIEESEMRALLTRVGLSVEAVRYGRWDGGRPEPLSYQDLVVARRI